MGFLSPNRQVMSSRHEKKSTHGVNQRGGDVRENQKHRLDSQPGRGANKGDDIATRQTKRTGAGSLESSMPVSGCGGGQYMGV